MKRKLREQALDKFMEGTEKSVKTDAATCDLLEHIAGKRFDIYFSDDDPIYTILGTLTNGELRRFIKGVDDILKS